MNPIENIATLENDKLEKIKKWGLTPEDIAHNKASVQKVSSKKSLELGNKMLDIIRKKNYNEETSDYDEVLKLIKAGAFINFKSNDNKGFTGLILCARNGYMNTFITLLKYGADVNLPDFFGITPLMSACVHNYCEMVEILIILGADVNARCKDGDTPLICAKKHDSKEAYDLLIKANAQIGQKNICNKTSIDYPSNIIEDKQYMSKENLNPIHLPIYEDACNLIEEAQEALKNIDTEISTRKFTKNTTKNLSFKRIL